LRAKRKKGFMWGVFKKKIRGNVSPEKILMGGISEKRLLGGELVGSKFLGC
jgi:hypothetical protein